MEKKSDRSARLIRSAMFAVNIVRQKHSLDFLGLIILIEKLPEAAGQKRNQLGDLGVRDAAKPLSHAEQVAPTFHTGGVDFRRRFQKKRLQIPSQLFQLIVNLNEPFGVFD